MKIRKELLFKFWRLWLIFICAIGCMAFCIHLCRTPHPTHLIESYAECEEALNELEPGSLVLFDINDTLLYSLDASANFRKSNISLWFLLRLLINFPWLCHEAAREQLISQIIQQAPHALIDENVQKIIENLKSKGVDVLALTNLPTGSYGILPCMEEWFYTTLKGLGITFSATYPDTVFTTTPAQTDSRHQLLDEETTTKHMPSYRGNFPTLYKGMLCTNQTDKGKVLGAFLEYAHLHPARILFFDDTAGSLQEVGNLCADRGIPCTLYLYRGAEKLTKPFSIKRTLLQVGHLLRTGVWLSDNEVDSQPAPSFFA